ncbi:MAG TPA: hypothetical protein VFZ11_04975 [Gemmatimonadaceae bacterium]
MLAIFIETPTLAAIPALLFALLALIVRRRLVWIAAGAWLLYGVYEMLMERRILCSGECNIRVDLLLLYPALLALSVAAVVVAARRRPG